MGKQIGVVTYWLGSTCAALGLLARGLDVFGMNFIDFNTKGSGIGYHSLMDGTLFFYSISIATMVYSGLHSQASASSLSKNSEKIPQNAVS